MDNPSFKEDSESVKKWPTASESRDDISSKGSTTLVTNISLDITKQQTPVRTRCFYLKNFVGLSGGILCLLTAYNTLFYIQSSLHSRGGLGSLSLAVDYGAQVLACSFVPALLMKKIGYKWTLVLAMLGVGTYIGANMKATFASLLPTSALMGVGFASMWATMNCLVCDLAKGYATLTGADPTVTFTRFLGVFYTIVETGKIWGNLISSLALQPKGADHISDAQLAICGANYCNQKLSSSGIHDHLDLWNYTNGNETAPSSSGGATRDQVNTLCYTALGICGLGILAVLALVDSRRSSNDTSRLLSHILSTIKMMFNRDLQLLIVITICVGLVQSFYASDFTKSFLTCSLGIHQVGLVSTSYGVVVVLGSLLMGSMAQFGGRQFWLTLAATLNISDLLLMLYWVPNPDQIVIFYLIAVLWAMSTAIWLTILTGVYGDVFISAHEEAFSNHRLYECIGFVTGFIWSPQLCMVYKIYGIIALLVIGMAGYIGLEIRLRRREAICVSMNSSTQS